MDNFKRFVSPDVHGCITCDMILLRLTRVAPVDGILLMLNSSP
jgi:hypothetical protein